MHTAPTVGVTPSRQNDPINQESGGPAERLTELYAGQTARASGEQRASVARWQAKDDRFYGYVQRAVEGQDAPSEAFNVADDLQDLMKPLPVGIEAWRGVRNAEAVFRVPTAQLEECVGTVREVPLFLPTTLKRQVAEDEFTKPGTGPALYKIAAQAGTPALWVPPLGGPNNAYQQELLFPPGVVVRILGIDRTYSIPVVEVEVDDGEVGR